MQNLIGLTIGTGLGAGVIINHHLFAGPNCGAGEFGMVDYLDHCFEYYCSGQYFQNVYHIDGQEVFEKAKAGDLLSRAALCGDGNPSGKCHQNDPVYLRSFPDYFRRIRSPCLSLIFRKRCGSASTPSHIPNRWPNSGSNCLNWKTVVSSVQQDSIMTAEVRYNQTITHFNVYICTAET